MESTSDIKYSILFDNHSLQKKALLVNLFCKVHLGPKFSAVVLEVDFKTTLTVI